MSKTNICFLFIDYMYDIDIATKINQNVKIDGLFSEIQINQFIQDNVLDILHWSHCWIHYPPLQHCINLNLYDIIEYSQNSCYKIKLYIIFFQLIEIYTLLEWHYFIHSNDFSILISLIKRSKLLSFESYALFVVVLS